MKNILLTGAIGAICFFTSCTRQEASQEQTHVADTTATKQTNGMKNIISIVEIPTNDFSRAVTFYQTVLGIKIEEATMDNVTMGLFPNSGDGVFVQLIHGSDYKPSATGTVIYLNGGEDLQPVANKIEANGGKIILPKTAIAPEMGFFALFMDTEGNKVGLYSVR